MAAHPGTAHTAIWDKMDKNKVEGVAFDLTAKVLTSLTIAVVLFGVNSLGSVCKHRRFGAAPGNCFVSAYLSYAH